MSDDIDAADADAAYDAAVKKILSDRRILAWILKECTKELKDLSIEEIAFKCINGEPQISKVPVMPDVKVTEKFDNPTKISVVGVEDKTIKEGTVTFDIRFEAVVQKKNKVVHIIINIEAQNDFYPGYPLIKRGIYNCSRLISSQYGTVFTKSHYEKIKKAYSIWICTSPPKKRQNTITTYHFTQENNIGNLKEPLKNYDLAAVVIICLSKSENEYGEGVLKLLNTLLSSKISTADKKRVLENDFGIPMTEEMEGKVYNMCNLSKGVREEGKIEGKNEGLMQSIVNLMKNLRFTMEQAMEALGISESEQQKYKDMIEKR